MEISAWRLGSWYIRTSCLSTACHDIGHRVCQFTTNWRTFRLRFLPICSRLFLLSWPTPSLPCQRCPSHQTKVRPALIRYSVEAGQDNSTIYDTYADSYYRPETDHSLVARGYEDDPLPRGWWKIVLITLAIMCAFSMVIACLGCCCTSCFGGVALRFAKKQQEEEDRLQAGSGAAVSVGAVGEVGTKGQ